MTNVGQKSTCIHCLEEIIYIGVRWGHLSGTPRHPAEPIDENSTVHKLKTWPEYFEQLKCGYKTFEIRKNDRGFQAGHILFLQEFDPVKSAYTGEALMFRVGRVIQGEFGLSPDTCVMSLLPMDVRDALREGLERGFMLAKQEAIRECEREVEEAATMDDYPMKGSSRIALECVKRVSKIHPPFYLESGVFRKMAEKILKGDANGS